MFPDLTSNLLEKEAHLALAEARLLDLRASEQDPLSLLAQHLDHGFVAFCGAGISIPPPSAAPGFLDLRNALICALAELLCTREVLSVEQYRTITSSLESLGRREDISFPPEMMFSGVKESMGAATVTRLLACLDENEPNVNHLALAKLSRDGTLAGIITPNFDTHIEDALALRPQERHVVGMATGKPYERVRLLKPHGSLDMPASILVTLETVIFRAKDAIVDRFRRMLENRTSLIVGYSGADYDLHPLLIYAGRNWNCRMVWVLWNETAMNENVAKLQLALGSRCVIVDGHRRAVLAELAGMHASIGGGSYSASKLQSRFYDIMKEHRTINLIAAFHQAVDPYVGVSPAVQGAFPGLGLGEHVLEALFKEAHDTAARGRSRFDAIMQVARSSDLDP